MVGRPKESSVIVIGRFEPSERVAAQRPYFENLLTEAGHDAATLQWGLLRHCCVTESRQEALEFAENARWQLRVASSLRRRKEVQVGYVIQGDEPMPNEAAIEDILATQMVGGVRALHRARGRGDPEDRHLPISRSSSRSVTIALPSRRDRWSSSSPR